MIELSFHQIPYGMGAPKAKTRTDGLGGFCCGIRMTMHMWIMSGQPPASAPAQPFRQAVLDLGIGYFALTNAFQ